MQEESDRPIVLNCLQQVAELSQAGEGNHPVTPPPGPAPDSPHATVWNIFRGILRYYCLVRLKQTAAGPSRTGLQASRPHCLWAYSRRATRARLITYQHCDTRRALWTAPRGVSREKGGGGGWAVKLKPEPSDRYPIALASLGSLSEGRVLG